MITPTHDEKMAWAKCANSFYSASMNWYGHRMSSGAALSNNTQLSNEVYDVYARIYRQWLVSGTQSF